MAKIGCIRVPLAVLLSSGDHVYMMNQAECTTLIYHEKMAPRVKEMMPQLSTVRPTDTDGDCFAPAGPRGH